MAGNLSSAIKAYALPLLLFSLSVFYQLFVIPRSFPPSHYDVLKIRRYVSIDDVKVAYDKLYNNWNSGAEVPSTVEFIKARYAYELLSNPWWKRDYDLFGIDDQLHVLENATEKYAKEDISRIPLPLLDAYAEPEDYAFNVIKAEDFRSIMSDSKPWLVQIYSRGSNRCAKFFNLWKEIAALLDGIANTGMVELGEVQLAMSLAEKKPTGHFFFRKGIPSLVAFPPGCKSVDCLIRFDGELSTDAITDWFATTVLSLPRILYYSKETLAQNFLAKSGPHKVKVIFFSKTGERATPLLRQTAKMYWAYSSYAFVLWREEDFSFWWNAFEVESAPAIVIMKDPGVKPLVFHGSVNNSWFLDVMEKNKLQELPQLRSLTSMELGCDAKGHSRAGSNVVSWYCVILAGRLGPELNKMRGTMCRVQELLLSDSQWTASDREHYSLVSTTLQQKRLTFSWLDGEAQHKYCFFYLHSETSYDTCGPRRDLADVPRLFIVRYKRNLSEESIKVERKPKNIWTLLEDEDVDPASQLVARYNGSEEIPEIIRWISKTVKDGESRDLPQFKTRTPDLVPEDSEPIWSRGGHNVLSKASGMKHAISGIISKTSDYLGDPRVGPMLLLGALMSFGAVWLVRSQPSRPNQSSQPNESGTSQPNESGTKDQSRPTRKERRGKTVSKKEVPPSITDSEPKNAYQMPLSDSDTE